MFHKHKFSNFKIIGYMGMIIIPWNYTPIKNIFPQSVCVCGGGGGGEGGSGDTKGVSQNNLNPWE